MYCFGGICFITIFHRKAHFDTKPILTFLDTLNLLGLKQLKYRLYNKKKTICVPLWHMMTIFSTHNTDTTLITQTISIKTLHILHRAFTTDNFLSIQLIFE